MKKQIKPEGKRKPRRGWCSRCGANWCDIHYCRSLDCAKKRKEPVNAK